AANALLSYVTYIGQMFWPTALGAFYPHRGPALSMVAAAAAGVALAGFTVLAVCLRRRCPYLLVGWLWYLGTLVPVVGLVQVGVQARADRYTYVPLIGLFLALVWGAADVGLRRWGPHVLAAAAAVVLLACALLTWRQVHVWRDDYSLWSHTLEVA